MGFFNKIKQNLGMGTISFELVVPDSVAGSSGSVEGDIVITAKSPQKVKDVEVKFERVLEWQERGTVYNSTTEQTEDQWNSRSQTVLLGHFIDKTAFSLAQHEKKTIHFTIGFAPFAGQGTSTDVSGFLSDIVDIALSSGTSTYFGSDTRDQTVHYKLSGDADLDDVAFDKGDSKRIVVV